MPAAEHRREDTDRNEPPIGARTILIAGLVMMAAGAFTVAHALSAGPALPPAAAQDIPAAVSTQAPAPPGTAAIAAPLPASAPATIEIPVLKVNAPVTPLDLNADGTVQVPPLANHNLAGWYDRSAAPGAQGTSVILGHVDDYAGPSVFYNLKNLSAGDAVDITRADGTTAVFTVDGVQKAAKASFPASDVYGTVPYPALRLVTCGGPFNAKTGQYTDSIVVYAHLTGTTTQ